MVTKSIPHFDRLALSHSPDICIVENATELTFLSTTQFWQQKEDIMKSIWVD
jgi:hypothetical protein